MNPLPDLDKMLGLLRSRGQLLASGLSDRRIAAKVQHDEFTRIRPGWFIATETWKASTPVDQHLLRALCVHSSTTRTPVFSGLTAAAILGLPLLRFDTERVHVLQPRTTGKGSSAGLVRHRQDFDQTDVLQRGPLSCTSVSRTLIDIARTCSFEQGVVAGDAGLRFQTSAGPLTADANRSSLLQNLRALPGTRGARRATRVLDFLDDQAESPLESLFRLQFARLGFEVRTQVPVPSPNGGRYRMDFELIGHRTFFEADGRAKYTDEKYLRGRKPEDLLIEEKRREDWIRGTQDYRVLHGGWNDALSPRATAKLLRGFGIAPPVDPGDRMPPELY